MNSGPTVTSGLYAALRLARGRPDGAMLVADDHRTLVLSFWSILLCLPSVISRLLMVWAATGVPKNAAHLMGREIVVFVLGWLLFVEVTHRLAPMLGKAEHWGRFIAVWNWCNVVESLLVVIGGVPDALRAPAVVDQAAELITIGWALWLEWFATRLTLGVGSLTAAWLVLLDQSIGILLASVAITLVS